MTPEEARDERQRLNQWWEQYVQMQTQAPQVQQRAAWLDGWLERENTPETPSEESEKAEETP
jgi:hypothetical protein